MAESAVQNPAFDALGRSPEALPFWSRYGLPLRVMFPAANTKRDIPHGLGAVPTGYMVLWSDAPITAAPGVRWTSEIAYLQSTAANARAIIVFLTFRESELALMPSWDVGPSVTPPDGGGGIPALHHQTHEDGGTDEVALDASQIVSGIINSARLPATTPGLHHATHEPGGSDALVNAAWTNLANVFTQDQALQSSAPALKLNDISQGADARLFLVRNAGQYFRVDAYNDALTVQTGSCVMDRAGGWHVGGHSYVIGNATVGGLLTVNGFGTHSFSASGTGYQNFIIQNTADGAGNAALIDIRAGSTITQLLTYAPSWSTSGPSIAGSTLLYAGGAGGLGLFANHVSGAIRFYSGGATERMRIEPNGDTWIGGTSPTWAPGVAFAFNASTRNPLVLRNLYTGNSGNFLLFINAADGLSGGISQVNATTVAFNTTSDQRLKLDKGMATDVAGLRALVVHDFTWNTDGTTDRGVFAQEAHLVFPRAVTVGSDGADLSRPWMTDYSKFVPDLIVGWQQHDADIQALKALVKDFHA